MESLQLEFYVVLPFLKTLYFFIVLLFLRLHSLLVLKKKDIREKNAVIAVRVSSFQFLKQPAFFLLRFSRRLQGQNHNYRVPSFGNI